MIRRRGRRKKSDIVNFSINESGDLSNNTVFFNSESSREKSDRENESISFGQLNIVVHTAKETEAPVSLFENTSSLNTQIVRKTPTQSTLQNIDRVVQKEVSTHQCKIDTTVEHFYPELPKDKYINSDEPPLPPKKEQEKNNKTPKQIVRKEKDWSNNSTAQVVEGKTKRLKLYNADNTEVTLPLKSDCWCWWCSHPFDTQPAYIPEHYDNVKDVFYLAGNFCSWNCAKSYLYSQKSIKVGMRCSLLSLLRRKLQGKMVRDCIRPAPPREVLKVFGGSLTIEEFRNNNTCDYEPIRRGLVMFTSNKEESELFKYRRIRYID